MATSKSGNGKGKPAAKQPAKQPTTRTAARASGTPQSPVTKPGARETARAKDLHAASVEDRERALRVQEATRSITPRAGSEQPTREAARMSREDMAAHLESLGLQCQGPRGEDGARTGCGFNVGQLIAATPFDGREYDYRCPECGNEGSFRAPKIELVDPNATDGDDDPKHALQP